MGRSFLSRLRSEEHKRLRKNGFEISIPSGEERCRKPLLGQRTQNFHKLGATERFDMLSNKLR